MPIKIDGTGYIGTANNIYTDAYGNVGIGAASSGVKLDITDTVNSAAGQLRLNSSGSYGTRMTFVSTSTNGRSWQIGSNFVDGIGDFSVYDQTAAANRMRIDSSGRVTKAFQPSFFVWSNYSSGGGPSGIYIFANVDHNIGSGYSTATGRFTAPIAGRYLLMTGILSRSGAGMNMSMRKNGSIIAYAEDSRTGGYGEANITLVVNLNASDYIDINLSNSSYGGAYDWFSGYLLG